MSAVKLEDIARQLGVSISTVSRALSGNGRVGEKTRQRVLAAVQESKYTVNAVARSLRLRDARNIGIIVPDISNSYFAAVIKGAQEVCRQSGYALMVCNSDEDRSFEEEALRTLLEKQASGLILASVGGCAELLGQYAYHDAPIVFIDNIPQGVNAADVVSIDNFAAARELTRAMLARGYREIGMITGPGDQSTGSLRRAGFEQALVDAGLAPRPEWVLEGDFRMASGRACMESILRLEERPRAMIIANNYMTYGAINAIRVAGLRIPEDIALAAFDALDETGLITPLITSLNQPAQRIGRRAAEIILSRLTGEERRADEEVVLKPVLFEGGSW